MTANGRLLPVVDTHRPTLHPRRTVPPVPSPTCRARSTYATPQQMRFAHQRRVGADDLQIRELRRPTVANIRKIRVIKLRSDRGQDRLEATTTPSAPDGSSTPWQA